MIHTLGFARKMTLAVLGTVLGCAASGAMAADAPAQAASDGDLNEIVITGIRGSLEASANRKRKANQILENVSAEDIGKLPDNNVVEALAHVTGVQITRQHGQGADMSIRGLQEVGTTINGNAAASGELRSMNHNDENGGTCSGATIQGACNGSQAIGATLSDIPSELIKSVTVYKTRTADQIEGGIGGQVDVELRRPLDLTNGYTLAGGVRDVKSSIGNLNSPSFNVLAAHRGDAGSGQFGWLLNVAYDINKYQEQLLVTESPQGFFAGTINGQPASSSGLMSAYQIWEGVQQGEVKRPSVSAALQWRTEGGIETVLEGSYLGNREVSSFDYLQAKTSGDGNPVYSNIVLQPGTSNVGSMTMTAPTGRSLPMYVVSSYIHSDIDNYHTNLESNWSNDRWVLKGGMQYDWSKIRVYDFYTVTGLNNVSTVDVNFDSMAVPGGTAAFTLPAGYSLLDQSNYNLYNFHDNLNTAKSHSLAAKFDATYDLSESGFFRTLQGGVRFAHSNTDRFFGYRDSDPNGPNGGMPLTSWPAGQPLSLTTVSIAGVSIPSWYHLDNANVYANLGKVRNAILGLDPTCTQCTAAPWDSRFDWTTPAPAVDADAVNHYSDHESNLALYSQFTYGFKAHFPVNGVIGVRATHTYGGSSSGFVLIPNFQTNPNAVITRGTAEGSGNYWDALPSLNAMMHFTPSTQLRAAYTFDIQRPAFSDLSPYVFIDANATHAWGGNPDLQPNRIRNFDLALEHYFGRGGLVSVGAYRKLLSAPFFNYSTLETVGGVSGQIPVSRPRNAGGGTYQGYEFAARGFFEFLPGLWRNLGAGVNGTYYQQFTIKIPDGLSDGSYTGSDNAPYTSKYTFNAEVYYSTPKLDARLSYNYRSKYKADPYYNWPLGQFDSRYTWTSRPTSRLDAAVSYTPIKQLTVSLEATNLLKNNNSAYYGYTTFPAEYRLQARTVQLGVRFRM